MLDAVDFLLVNRWQRGFPLVPRPFAAMGSPLGLTEAQVVTRFEQLRRRGIIDRIGPVFRPNTVGASTLAAMAVPRHDLERVAGLVGACPGVNHNYEREHRFSLWFVVTGETHTQVEAVVASIEAASGRAVLRLPLAEEFHIDLGFDLDTHAAPRGMGPGAAVALMEARERELVGATARGLPLVSQPYLEVGTRVGMPEEVVISLFEELLRRGCIRRIGAVVRHRSVGYEANAMVVWDAPDAAAGELGRRLAAERAVTLCYRRRRALPDWRYNLYCMIHGRSRGPVWREVNRISAAHGIAGLPRAVLFSRRCFSQRAARYG